MSRMSVFTRILCLLVAVIIMPIGAASAAEAVVLRVSVDTDQSLMRHAVFSGDVPTLGVVSFRGSEENGVDRGEDKGSLDAACPDGREKTFFPSTTWLLYF